MTKFLGILAAALVGSAMGGAARAGDWCDYPQHDRDGYRDEHRIYHDDYRDYEDRDRGDRGDRGEHLDHRARLQATDCGDFRYRDWLPRRQTYVFWSPSDRSWYYWCTTSHSYLPYDQFDAHPPGAGVIPDMPKGLPPVLPGGADRPPVVPGSFDKDKDLGPPVGRSARHREGPAANVVLETPKGLPPGGADRPPFVPGSLDKDKELMPPAPPDDAPIRP